VWDSKETMAVRDMVMVVVVFLGEKVIRARTAYREATAIRHIELGCT
jgi:hypothetical protein